MLIRRLLSSVAVAGVALAASAAASAPAFAAWESIHACPTSNFAKLTARDNRPLRLAAGFSGEVEVFGHLLDTVRDVGLTGISGAPRPSVVRGDSGFVNGGSGYVGRTGPEYCALGSLVVKVTIPTTAPRGQRGTLQIGGERIPIEVVLNTFAAAWDPRNESASLSPGSQEQIEFNARQDAAARRNACLQGAAARFNQCVADRPALVAERAARCAEETARRAAQQASGATGVQLPGAQSSCTALLSCDQLRVQDERGCEQLAEPRISEPRAPRCLRDLGGSSLYLADGTLEITLPPPSRASDAALDDCLRRGFEATLDPSRASRDYGLTSPIGRTSVSRTTGGVAWTASDVGAVNQIVFPGKPIVLRLPGGVRSSGAVRANAQGTITIAHGGVRDSASLGDATTTLRYAIVQPKIELPTTPSTVTRPVRRPF